MQKKTLTRDEIGTLILLAAILFGGWFRLMPAWLAGFPVNDGGMFYTMIKDLQASHYFLPSYTTYNHLNIPYVYPPLGFYAGALLTDILNLQSPMPIIQWLPGILNTLCIPAFYLLAKELTGLKYQSAIAALAFAFTPHLTSWPSMGGGLTRSLGMFFMLLALVYIHRSFTGSSPRDIWAAILLGGLTVLSHTEAPLYATAIAIYFWAVRSRSLKGALNAIWIAIGILLITSPWSASILYRHGLSPILSASQTSLRDNWSILRLINVDFMTEEPYLDLIGVAGITGMAVLAARKDFFIPGLFLVIALANPRSAHTMGNIPLAIAAGFFIAEILLKPSYPENDPTGQGRPTLNTRIIVIILTPFLLGNLLYYETLLAQNHVSIEERTAMQWVRENTPEESSFLVITGETNGFCDSTSEWFPALTGRQSIATLQGNEWLRGSQFNKFIGDIQNLQSCSREGLNCITVNGENIASDFNYVYVSLAPPTFNCNPSYASGLSRGLLLELQESPQFESVFTSEWAAIFRKR